MIEKKRNDAEMMMNIRSRRCSKFTSGTAEGDTETQQQHENMEDRDEEEDEEE